MTLALVLVVPAVVALVFVVALCRAASKADAALAAAMGAILTCTRPAPHVCKTNGPCNGWPKGLL